MFNGQHFYNSFSLSIKGSLSLGYGQLLSEEKFNPRQQSRSSNDDDDGGDDGDEYQMASPEQHTLQNVDNIVTDNSPKRNINDHITQQSLPQLDNDLTSSEGGGHGFRQISGSVSPRSDDEPPVQHRRRMLHSRKNIDKMLKELALTSPEPIETGPLKHRIRQGFDSSSPRSLDYSTSHHEEQRNDRHNHHRRRSSDGNINVQKKKEVNVKFPTFF